MAASRPAIVLLAGEDAIQRDAKIKQLAKAAFGGEDYEVKRFDAAERQAAFAIEELLSFSMLDPNRVVVLERADALSKRGEKSGDAAAVFEFIENPRGESPFIMTADSIKDVSAALKKALPKEAIVTLEKTGAAKIRNAVVKRCNDAGVEIEPKALKYFLDRCGDDASAAQRELEKILLWAEPGQPVTEDDCRRLIEAEGDESIWELVNAAGRKESRAALGLLRHRLDQGDHPVQIVGALANHFRLLFACRSLKQDGVAQAQWPKRMGKPEWMIGRAANQASQFSIDALREALRLLHEADSGVKGARPDDVMTAERLVIDLCRLA